MENFKIDRQINKYEEPAKTWIKIICKNIRNNKNIVENFSQNGLIFTNSTNSITILAQSKKLVITTNFDVDCTQIVKIHSKFNANKNKISIIYNKTITNDTIEQLIKFIISDFI